jgi:zinc transporter ZupT
MVYVISSELIPELRGKGKELGVFLFHLGFILMMTLDVVLG